MEMSREELALLLFLYVSFVWSSQQTFKQEKLEEKVLITRGNSVRYLGMIRTMSVRSILVVDPTD